MGWTEGVCNDIAVSSSGIVGHDGGMYKTNAASVSTAVRWLDDDPTTDSSGDNSV